MTRFQRLAAVALATTLALVVVGVVVRAIDAGLGCPDWPFCYGQVVPPLGDLKAWAEWIHRLIAAVVGLLVLGVAVLAVADHRDRRSLLWPTIGAVVLVVFQAWLGRETVRLGNSGDSVTAHLAAAMALAGLLGYIVVRARYPGRIDGRGSSQRFTLLVAFAAATTYALLLFGANVTARNAALVFPDWPLMGGAVIPPFDLMVPRTAELAWAQALHRYVAVVVGLILLVTWLVARRTQRRRPAVLRLVTIAAVVYLLQVVVGAAQIWTQLAPWSQTLHVTLAALTWTALVIAAVESWYAARVAGAPSDGLGQAATGRGGRAAALSGDALMAAGDAGLPTEAIRPAGTAAVPRGEAVVPPAEAGAIRFPGSAWGAGPPRTTAESVAQPRTTAGSVAPPRTTAATIRAYVALTKPRIIELLLITTVPAMVLATRDQPGVDWVDWGVLVFWTLLGGTLAAGSANAINQYLDRDIDSLMARTRRRPLPSNAVAPENALLFGIVLGIVAVALLAWRTNLLAAFLTLLAIAFYVVVYTLMLKRTTTQNIVIGGAAGALPPVIGWAAVTGRVDLPALLLFAVVFYWTPPHFWALSLRIAKDYAAAGVPMLPVVRGAAETTRQILLYTILLVAISLVMFAVARMGIVYLASALALGTIFVWQAARLARAVTVDGTMAGAIRLYRYSISYLTLLFLAVAVDALVIVRLG